MTADEINPKATVVIIGGEKQREGHLIAFGSEDEAQIFMDEFKRHADVSVALTGLATTTAVLLSEVFMYEAESAADAMLAYEIGDQKK